MPSPGHTLRCCDLGDVSLLSQVLPLTLYSMVASVNRFHLFVWTVFSPKMLYQAADTLLVSVFAAGFYVISTYRFPRSQSVC